MTTDLAFPPGLILVLGAVLIPFAAERQRLLDARLGRLKRILIVLVITSHGELGGCRVHTRDGEHGNHDEQNEPDDERGALLLLVGLVHSHLATLNQVLALRSRIVLETCMRRKPSL